MGEAEIREIFDAIEIVTGVTREEISGRSRLREYFFGRMLAAHHLRLLGCPMDEVCLLLGGVRPRHIHYLERSYINERTPYFRRCADKVQARLDNN